MAAVPMAADPAAALASSIAALGSAGASRHVVATALAAGLRTLADLANPLLDGIQSEVDDRVAALRRHCFHL